VLGISAERLVGGLRDFFHAILARPLSMQSSGDPKKVVKAKRGFFGGL